MSDYLDIQKLIDSAGEVKKVYEGLTVFKIGYDPGGNPVKIRIYATEGEAQEKENLLLRLKEDIKYPDIIGRWKNCLVFRYLEVGQRIAKDSDHDPNYSIGKFLGLINTKNTDDMSEDDLEKELSDWLIRLSKMKLIPHWIVNEAQFYYKLNKPEDLPICIDYWDAMPHNFGWIGNDFYLLDEKHLRPSFQGVGLIKPRLLLVEADWLRVKAGYEQVSSIQAVLKNIGFLTFYYHVAALYFYSLSSAAGRISLGTNLRFLDYREKLVEIVAGGDSINLLKNEYHLYRTFPKDIPFLVKRRILAG